MRPKIMPCRNITKSLRYNEDKVDHNQAQCIVAANFLKDINRLTFDDKLSRFRRLAELNERVVVNQHITLNFDPADKLSDDRMQMIVKRYMKEIGFERQPYLAYRHHDAGHPHCHIVTTHIQRNGDPIAQWNIGRNQSEQARLRIEKEFGLVTAESKQQMNIDKQDLNGVRRVTYGASSLARSVSDVVRYVSENFRYTTLDEFNAVLKMYNVHAYRGRETSQLYQHRGLLYRVLDKNGSYIGVPLKASFFVFKPTLDNLEKRMALNQFLRQVHKKSLTNRIHWAFWDPHGTKTLEHANRTLTSDGVNLVVHQNKAKEPQAMYFIDWRNKTVFDSKTLDEQCGLPIVQKLMAREQTLREQLSLDQRQKRSLRHR